MLFIKYVVKVLYRKLAQYVDFALKGLVVLSFIFLQIQQEQNSYRCDINTLNTALRLEEVSLNILNFKSLNFKHTMINGTWFKPSLSLNQTYIS